MKTTRKVEGLHGLACLFVLAHGVRRAWFAGIHLRALAAKRTLSWAAVDALADGRALAIAETRVAASSRRHAS